MEKTKETSNRKQSNRRQAISWWNNLTWGGQYYHSSKLRDCTPDCLTGREIEEIWKKENPIAALPDELINTNFDGIEEEHSYKPNKKQFVEFNEDLFKAYINKFSDLGKRKAIEMLLKNCDFQKAELIKECSPS